MAYIGRQGVIGNFVKLDAISVVNGQAAYTMQNNSVNFTDYSTVNQFLVSLNGTVQSPGSSFTVASSVITFASNLSTGDVIDFIIVFGNSLSAGTPTDGSVTSAKINYPLTTFSSTGIDDNATSTAMTIDSSENVGIGISPTPPTAYGGLHIHSTYPVMKLSSTATGSGTGDGFVTRIDSTPRVELWNFENSDMVFATNNTERMRIRAGGGLAIGGTGDANTLDDYEEGLHTPTLSDTSGNVTSIALNSSYNQLAYTKIGRLVHISGTIVISSFSGSWGSGALRMTLPFTAADLADQAGKSTMSVGVYNVDFTAGTSPYMQVTENTTNADFYVSGDNNTGGKCQPQSSGQLYIGGCYIAA